MFSPVLKLIALRPRDGVASKHGLDRALVHYLRSKYPHDKDTLRLVALHFLLYTEVKPPRKIHVTWFINAKYI